MSTEMTQVAELIKQMEAGWKAGSGERFAAPYAERVHFVTFDGTMLESRQAVAAYHQQAFDTHLKGTAIRIEVHEVRQVAEEAWLVFSTSSVGRAEGPPPERTGDSVQLFLFKREEGAMRAEAFQNTRVRPITDGATAGVWRQFDELWETR